LVILIVTRIEDARYEKLKLYQSYLNNRYCKTAISNANENGNRVLRWVKVRHGAPQGSILETLLFLLYIYDLPKIINETSTPIIFANNTSILFAHPKLTDLSKNIQVIFTTLNKWLRANQLSLNFSKTNYLHFTTKRNMTTFRNRI
jgi:hypothetical protein